MDVSHAQVHLAPSRGRGAGRRPARRDRGRPRPHRVAGAQGQGRGRACPCRAGVRGQPVRTPLTPRRRAGPHGARHPRPGRRAHRHRAGEPAGRQVQPRRTSAGVQRQLGDYDGAARLLGKGDRPCEQRLGAAADSRPRGGPGFQRAGPRQRLLPQRGRQRADRQQEGGCQPDKFWRDEDEMGDAVRSDSARSKYHARRLCGRGAVAPAGARRVSAALRRPERPGSRHREQSGCVLRGARAVR